MTRSGPRRRSRLRQAGELALLRVAASVLPRFPEGVDRVVASVLGWLVGSVLRVRRRTVARNLLTAFPERSARWRRKVARGAYRHFAAEAVALLRFDRMSKSEVANRVELIGTEMLEEALATGRGAIFLAGHFGNWELAALGVAAKGLSLDAVVRRQTNPWFDEYMLRARGRLGMGVVYRDEATREVPKRIRQSRVVALVADQNAPRGGIFVDFFGRPAATARGPGVLGLRTGTTIFFVDPMRLGGRRARYRMGLHPLRSDVGSTLEERVHALTRAFMHELEMRIREAPEQYFWFHDRWKTRPQAAQTAGTAPRGSPPALGGPEDSA